MEKNLQSRTSRAMRIGVRWNCRGVMMKNRQELPSINPPWRWTPLSSANFKVLWCYKEKPRCLAWVPLKFRTWVMEAGLWMAVTLTWSVPHLRCCRQPALLLWVYISFPPALECKPLKTDSLKCTRYSYVSYCSASWLSVVTGMLLMCLMMPTVQDVEDVTGH